MISVPIAIEIGFILILEFGCSISDFRKFKKRLSGAINKFAF